MVKNLDGWIPIYNILKDLFLSTFKWNDLPKTVNARFLEMSLFDYGKVVFFKDDVIGHLALKATQAGKLNVYYEPTTLHAYGGNGYQKTLQNNINSIIIYHNLIRDTPQLRVEEYAKRIYALEQTIDINVYAQRTPIIISTSKKQEYTLKNIYKKYDGFEPVIVVDNELDLASIKAIQTESPFVARDLMDLKKQIWNEALSYIGIENNSAEKNERLTKNEVMVSNGMAIASRNSKLATREMAVKLINEMFGLNISVELNNISFLEMDGTSTEESDLTEGGEDNE